MLDLSQRMEVSYKVNKLIKKANDALNLGLHQPNITYKLKGTDVVKTIGNTINFNSTLFNKIVDADIQREVAHVINIELNHEHNANSETYINIQKLLSGKAEVIINVKPNVTPKKVVTTKSNKSAVKVVNGNKAIAMTAYRDAKKENADITRQEMITVIVEALHFNNDKPSRIKAAGFYQQAKKAIEA